MLTGSYLLEIAAKALKLFQGSKTALKSKLLRLLLSNLEIHDKKLVSNLEAPSDVIAEYSQTANWRTLAENVWNYFMLLDLNDSYTPNILGTVILHSRSDAAM